MMQHSSHLWVAVPLVSAVTVFIDGLTAGLVAFAILFLMSSMEQEDNVDLDSPQRYCLPCPTSIHSLKMILEQAGIDTTKFGVAGAKSLASLFDELQRGVCILGSGGLTGRVTRRAEPIFLVLTMKGKILVETCRVMPDGAIRERSMLPAGKRHPKDHDVSLPALSILHKELGVKSDGSLLPEGFVYRREENTCITEEMLSTSYPGLPCEYRSHQVTFSITAETMQQSCIGLPTCEPFETREHKPEGVVVHRWEWTDHAAALNMKVKGLFFEGHEGS